MVHGTQGMDALPVAKVIDYPLEERDYRPFAQNILCLSDGSLRLRMWAFEVSPADGSELLAVLYLFAEKDLSLHVRIAMEREGTPVRRVALVRGDELVAEIADYEFHNYSGEDLQGVYWGGEIGMDIAILERLGGPVLTKPGDSFPGNFYKVQTKERTHYGSFAPCNWDTPYVRAGMEQFTVVDY